MAGHMREQLLPPKCGASGPIADEKSRMERKLTLADKLMRLPFLKKFVRHLAIKITSVAAIRKALRLPPRRGNCHRECGSGYPYR